MWITVKSGEEPLWEGEFVAIESEWSAGERSYRDSSAEPALATESPGTVSIGRPQVLPLASVYEAGKLQPAVEVRLQQADYFLVQLSCSFRPERNEVIDWARFAVSLNSSSPGDVFAAELHPFSVRIKEKRNVKVGISSSLKFCEVAESGTEFIAGVEYPELIPIITAAGVGESRPSWDYTSTPRRQIAGSKLMSMIVRAPKGTDRLTASLAIEAVVKARRFRILFGPDKRSEQLHDIQLWLARPGQRPDAKDSDHMKDSTMEYEAPKMVAGERISGARLFQRTRNDMTIIRRIYISMPADRWLSAKQNDLKWGIVEEIERLGYIPEIFTDPTGRPGLAAGQAWSAVAADEVARRCVGAAIIGLPRWLFSTSQGDLKLPTEYCHYEGAVAYTLGLPMLVVVQDDVQRRVVFHQSFRGHVGQFPATADRSWLGTNNFRVPFNYWKEELSKRRDVFLGYCISSSGVANNIKRFLKADIGATVLDWQTDFSPGRSILQQIEEAVARCSAGVFLFTKDDKLTDDAHTDKAVPRDNVVFEAGYFVNAKGKDHVLIVREGGAKMPADLGGDIYASLEERSNIGPIEDQVRRFVAGW